MIQEKVQGKCTAAYALLWFTTDLKRDHLTKLENVDTINCLVKSRT